MNAPATRPFANRSTGSAVVKPDEQRSVQVRQLEQELSAKLTQIASLLPPKLGDPKRFARMVVMACVRNPDLLNCDRTTLYAAVMNCAELGLSCTGGPGGRAHLVPFKGKVTLIPDYKGLIDIALDSGFYSGIEAHCVHAADDFQIRLGTESSLRHIPAMGSRGEIVGAYAVAHPVTGRPVFRYLSVDEIHAKRPQHTFNERDDNPWNTSSAEMCCKTAVRALYKWLKTTPAMERVIDVDASGDVGDMPPPSMVAADIQSATAASPAPAQTIDEHTDFAAEASQPEDDGTPPELRRVLDLIAAAKTDGDLKAAAAEAAKLPDALKADASRAYMEKKTALKGGAK